jgi:hypothetical protein
MDHHSRKQLDFVAPNIPMRKPNSYFPQEPHHYDYHHPHLVVVDFATMETQRPSSIWV